jgi:integrase
MRRSRPTDLGTSITRFFEEYLPGQRGMSVHTIRSYRDAVVLMLQFTARDGGRGVEQLSVKDFTAERVLKFLKSLEIDRHNGIATRNARLGALHVLARFLASERPEQLATLQRVINVNVPASTGWRRSLAIGMRLVHEAPEKRELGA